MLHGLTLVFCLLLFSLQSMAEGFDPSIDTSAQSPPSHGSFDPSGSDPVPQRVPSPKRFEAPKKTELGPSTEQYNRTLKAWNSLLDELDDEKNKVNLPDLLTPDFKGYLQRGLYGKLTTLRHSLEFLEQKKKPDPEDKATALYIQTRLENLELELWYIRQQAVEFSDPKLQADLQKAKKVPDAELEKKIEELAKRQGIKFDTIPKDVLKTLVEQERMLIAQGFIERARLKALEKLEKDYPKITKHFRIKYGKSSTGEKAFIDQTNGKVVPEGSWNKYTYKDVKTGKIKQLKEPPIYVDAKTGKVLIDERTKKPVKPAAFADPKDPVGPPKIKGVFEPKLVDAKTRKEVSPVRSPLTGELSFRYAIGQPLEKDALKIAVAEFKKPVKANKKITYVEDPAYATRVVRALEFGFRIED